jgi:hypothetical protein
MNLNINPKVISAALVAALAGGLLALGLALQNSYDTPKSLGLALLAAFITGCASGLSGWAKSQGNWTSATVGEPALPPANPPK